MEEKIEIQDHTRLYGITLISLLLITLIEYFVGFMDEVPLKFGTLIVLSIIKASLIVAVFMHVKFNKDWKVIMFVGFTIPLVLIIYLVIVLYADFAIQVGS